MSKSFLIALLSFVAMVMTASFLPAGTNNELLVAQREFPDIDISVPNYHFGHVSVGDTRIIALSVFNLGSADLDVRDIAFQAEGSRDYHLSSALYLPAVVTPEGSMDVEITFAPSVPGFSSSRLVIVTNDPDEPVVEIRLSGTGEEAEGTYDDQEAYEKGEDDSYYYGYDGYYKKHYYYYPYYPYSYKRPHRYYYYKYKYRKPYPRYYRGPHYYKRHYYKRHYYKQHRPKYRYYRHDGGRRHFKGGKFRRR